LPALKFKLAGNAMLFPPCIKVVRKAQIAELLTKTHDSQNIYGIHIHAIGSDRAAFSSLAETQSPIGVASAAGMKMREYTPFPVLDRVRSVPAP
jgi:hypothetical protein